MKYILALCLAVLALLGYVFNLNQTESSSYQEVGFGDVVIVRAIEPSDSQVRYSAFSVIPEDGRHTAEWLHIKNGEGLVNIQSDDCVLGSSSVSEEYGISYLIYSLAFSLSNSNKYWLGSVPTKLAKGAKTSYCLSEYKSIYELQGKDLSQCPSFN